MRLDRSGVTRTVILTRRWVIKVPSMRGGMSGPRAWLWSVTSGIQANLSEWEWSAHPSVCPVSWSLFGLVNVYRRAEPVPDDVELDYASIGAPLGEWSPLGLMDCKRSNVGLLDGRLVWLDYDQSAANCQACRRNRDAA